MLTINLHLSQVAALELHDINYTLGSRNKDGVTFNVSFEDIEEYKKALEVLLRV